MGHLDPKNSLKVGDTVHKGDVVGDNSTGNGQWAAHCHYDILTYLPSVWTEYVIGKSKDWVAGHYDDPRGMEREVLPMYDHLGYGWLEDANYSGGHAFHSGLDLNGKGSGNADLGDPITSPVDGVVRYVYDGSGSNGGWGGLVVIEEKIIEDPMNKEFVEQVALICGKKKDFYGENLNEKEQKDAAERIKEFREEMDGDAMVDAEKIKELEKERDSAIESLRKKTEDYDSVSEKLRDAEAKLSQSQKIEEGAVEATENWETIKKIAQSIKKVAQAIKDSLK